MIIIDKKSGFNDTYCDHKDCMFNTDTNDDRCDLSQNDVLEHCCYADDITVWRKEV
jgi:hypothetical protein